MSKNNDKISVIVDEESKEKLARVRAYLSNMIEALDESNTSGAIKPVLDEVSRQIKKAVSIIDGDSKT